MTFLFKYIMKIKIEGCLSKGLYSFFLHKLDFIKTYNKKIKKVPTMCVKDVGYDRMKSLYCFSL